MSKDTILILDDERFFCNLLQGILEKKYHIIISNNKKEAIEALNSKRIDLILLDIIMPEIDGYQICKEIKQNAQFSHIPIIFLTVKNEVEDELKGFNAGAVDYIIKPISPPIVSARVATHLALAKATKELQQHAINLEKIVSERTVELTREIAEKQKVYEKLHYLANYDQLTLLPNRNLFNERLAYAYKLAKRNNSSFSLLIIDLDRFKLVNDSLGHHIGDLLLEQVGQRLSNCLRGVDTIARLGGDEFTVTLTELHEKQDASIVANKIISEISQAFEIHGQIIHIGCSIGITSFPDDGENLADMLKNADMAMYEVKRGHKNDYAFFSPEMNTHVSYRMELEKDLYLALASKQLYLHYQPIIDLQSRKICTVEALLRWRHPKYGQVAPDKIISIAEESDLILTLGEWILEQACKQLSLWHTQGHTELRIAINMSTRQFDIKFNSTTLLKNLISKYNIPKNHIHLEITESLMLEDSKYILDTLSELKEIGVLLAVDDFGTGYSSLSYLRKFPIDILKIDQSFIRNFNLGSGDDILIKAIIAMGQSLNLAIIAEGVEDGEQLSFLSEQHCDQIQGYYFSKPVSADEISLLLKEKVNF
ncbi:MAG: EAL domain-containing protein [Methylococcales bacterium]